MIDDLIMAVASGCNIDGTESAISTLMVTLEKRGKHMMAYHLRVTITNNGHREYLE